MANHRHVVLLIEDEPELATLLAELLAEHETHTAANMTEAEALLETHRFCSIISDLTLPDVEREEVVRRLRAKGRGAAIVLMSAIAPQDLRALGSSQGVDAIISKPFDIDAFEQALVFHCPET